MLQVHNRVYDSVIFPTKLQIILAYYNHAQITGMVSVLGIKFQSKYELIKARTITIKALEPTKDKKIKEEEEEEEGKKRRFSR